MPGAYGGGHPNIVQIYDVGKVDGGHYIALEYVEGGNLANAVDGKPIAAKSAAALVETLARAMHSAHQNHAIHRDLKPANILLSGKWRAASDDTAMAQ